MKESVKNKQLICRATGKDDAEYFDMVFGFAQLWMERYFGTEKIVINALNNSKSFWAWWINQWDNRNAEFVRLTSLDVIELPLTGITQAMAIELYDETHATNELCIVPNKFVVSEVSKLIKQEESKLKNLYNHVR